MRRKVLPQRRPPQVMYPTLDEVHRITDSDYTAVIARLEWEWARAEIEDISPPKAGKRASRRK